MLERYINIKSLDAAGHLRQQCLGCPAFFVARRSVEVMLGSFCRASKLKEELKKLGGAL